MAFVLGLSGIASGSTYTVTIPDTLAVKNPGWNAIDGGISASGALDNGAQLVISVSSDNGFKFVNQSDNTATVPYVFAESGDSTTAYTSGMANKTEWTFTTLTETAQSQGAGIVIDDYSNAKGGTYSEVVTFTAEVQVPQTLNDNSGEVTLIDGDILTGTGGADTHVTIADGATITLSGVTITSIPTSNTWAGITCAGDATIILADRTTNSVKGGNGDYPGLYVPSGKTLTIKGGGTLTARSNGFGAGIGSGYQIACGNIVIEGGTITATGGKSAAGIGDGYQASCGNITIRGGTITATGGQNAAGIGDGNGASCDSITISGGTITATGGSGAAGIGGGLEASCGSITISGGTITATGGQNAAGIGSGSNNASCGDITIANTITSVTATKGNNALYSIGAGAGGSVGTITIGGTVGAITDSPYTYPPLN